MRALLLVSLAALLLAGCDESVGNPGPSSTNPTGGASDGITELVVAVPDSGRAYIDLSTAAVITPAEGDASTEWDLALSGYDVYTNSGPSGPGEGSAFGPLDVVDLQSETAPSAPFLTADTTGGAFTDWWKYDNAEHVIWSRYHVYGVKSADHVYRVQVLSFYGDDQGAPVSALYKVRYTEVFSDGLGITMTLNDIDGTAGGASPSEDTPSQCLDLATGGLVPLTPVEALASKAWDLCFRRNIVSVNGEYGGPKGVTAVDIDAAKTKGETLEEVKVKTAESELPYFNGVTHATLTAPDLDYRGDVIRTAFTGYWLMPDSSPPAPREAAWLVVGADGESKFVISFDRFEGATDTSPGKVTMRIKSVK